VGNDWIGGERPVAYGTFYRPCLDCGITIEVVDTVEQPHDCQPLNDPRAAIARAWWAGHDRAIQRGPTNG
jgi:hypothetical protein